MTGYEFLKFYIEIHKNIPQTASIDDYFELVGIEPQDRHRLIKGYSHGMKNKVQMLCFLIAKPPIILLDEPLTSFDVVAALEMKNLLRDIKKRSRHHLLHPHPAAGYRPVRRDRHPKRRCALPDGHRPAAQQGVRGEDHRDPARSTPPARGPARRCRPPGRDRGQQQACRGTARPSHERKGKNGCAPISRKRSPVSCASKRMPSPRMST